jgi:hypothetical protein
LERLYSKMQRQGSAAGTAHRIHSAPARTVSMCAGWVTFSGAGVLVAG